MGGALGRNVGSVLGNLSGSATDRQVNESSNTNKNFIFTLYLLMIRMTNMSFHKKVAKHILCAKIESETAKSVTLCTDYKFEFC